MENTNIKHPFLVPDGYFDQLEDSILAEVSIEKAFGKKDLSVPNGYFKELESNILSRVSLEKLISNAKVSVPENYFASLEDEILVGIKAEKLKLTYNLSVPDNYFESLETAVLNKTFSKKKSIFTIFSLSKNIYRAAAGIVLIGGASLFYLNYYSQPKDAFAEISSEEIASYLQNQSLSYYDIKPVVDETTVTEEINVIPESAGISEAELLKYIEENEI